MTSDRPPQNHLLLLGIPHPVTRALATYLRDVVAACDRPIGCELVTDDREVLRAGATLHLRPEATETLGLAASLRHGGDEKALARYALAARMDDRWRDVRRLPVERVLANPGHAVATLVSCLGVPATATMLAAADRGLAALRDSVAAFGHPLSFWRALGLEEADATEADGANRYGSVRLDEIDGADVPDALERVRPRPAPHDLLEGRERSPAAAMRVAAAIAEHGAEPATRVFVLAGNGWSALPVPGR